MPESMAHYFDLSLAERAELLHGLAWPDVADHVSGLVFSNAQMFYGEAMAFDRIVERLTTLEREINLWG